MSAQGDAQARSMADAVARRTPEIALRLALGAPRWRIVSGVMRYGTGLAVIGVTAGLLDAMHGAEADDRNTGFVEDAMPEIHQFETTAKPARDFLP